MDQLLERAAQFIWTAARLIDRQRYRFLFAGGTPDSVIAALRPYQNPDGGFGNALEPDLRGPDSQPVPGETALRILLETGADMPMVQRLCGYLQSITTADGGVPFVLPSVHRYPAAPWWQTDEHPQASANPTAALAGLLYALNVQHPWLDNAAVFCWRALDVEHADEHTLLALLTFLQYVPDRQRAERAFAPLGERLLAQGLVAVDPHAEGYVKKPLDWAPTPGSLCRRFFDDHLIDQHLDALVAAQQPDGGWPISWPAQSAGAEAEWRGAITVDTLKTLRAYGRLDA